MDIVAHGLWAAVGLGFASRSWRLTRRTTALTVALAVLPDLVQMLPIVAWELFSPGGLAVAMAYANALPGHEPALPPAIESLVQHLHCILHSAVVAAAVTLVLWGVRRKLWIPLLGWWSHIVIDVFTHSADFYPSPVLYPFTQRGFDGLAWNTPWFMVVNYVALLCVSAGLVWSRRGQARR